MHFKFNLKVQRDVKWIYMEACSSSTLQWTNGRCVAKNKPKNKTKNKTKNLSASVWRRHFKSRLIGFFLSWSVFPRCCRKTSHRTDSKLAFLSFSQIIFFFSSSHLHRYCYNTTRPCRHLIMTRRLYRTCCRFTTAACFLSLSTIDGSTTVDVSIPCI